MKSVFPKDQFQNIEEDICNSTGVSKLVLMENAGRSCAEYLLNNYSAQTLQCILILAGKGNNAGDGFVIARHLAMKGIRVKLGMLFPQEQIAGTALENYRLLDSFDESRILRFSITNSEDLDSAVKSDTRMILDCIFGIGFSGKLDDRITSVISKVNSLGNVYRIAIDIPTGLKSYEQEETCFRADTTLTMGALKLESLFYSGRRNSGLTSVMNIGIDDSEFLKRSNGLEMYFAGDIDRSLLRRDIASNKYSNGKLLVLSGSPGLSGAACLSSLSALRTGCGAVIAGVPRSVFPVTENKLTEVMKLQLAENSYGCLSLKAYDQIYEKIDWADVTLIGPGLSKNEETMELVRRIMIENNTKKFVIDADAVFAFKGFSNLLKGKDVILTPHFGEFTGLCELDSSALMKNFVNEARAFSEKTGATLVLKNAPTIVSDSGKAYINSTGRENLASAGTGDVLSGMISAIWAKSGKRLESAMAGTLLHGVAGDILFSESGQSSTIAGDLISKISAAKENAGLG